MELLVDSSSDNSDDVCKCSDIADDGNDSVSSTEPNLVKCTLYLQPCNIELATIDVVMGDTLTMGIFYNVAKNKFGVAEHEIQLGLSLIHI